MRLEDFGIILLMLAACAAALFGGMALVSLWPQIRQFVRALWRRYVTFSWDDLLWRVADASVNDFEEPAPPPFANRPVMSRAVDDPHARTGAVPSNARAPDGAAVRAGADGAGVRETPPIIAFSEHRAQQAARRMIRHKIENPSADMLDTIRAGFPEIKSRSGDPSSKYQRYGKPLYDALFAEPESDFPTLATTRRPSVVGQE